MHDQDLTALKRFQKLGRRDGEVREAECDDNAGDAMGDWRSSGRSCCEHQASHSDQSLLAVLEFQSDSSSSSSNTHHPYIFLLLILPTLLLLFSAQDIENKRCHHHYNRKVSVSEG